MKKLIYILFAAIILTSCEDDVVKDYIPRTMVEAFLIVNQPIKDIRLYESQPIFNQYDLSKSVIRDAEVYIRTNGDLLKLQIDSNGTTYYYSDSTYKVKPNSHYDLEIRLKDGTVITGATDSPGEMFWTLQAKDTIQYPKDTLHLQASEYVGWSKVPNVDFYYGSIKCLDTLNYGKYLTPATEETNRRCYNFINEMQDGEPYKEISMGVLLATTRTSAVWNVFKWFGLQSIEFYAPDKNLLKWIIQSMQIREYDERMSSVTNACGCFGSASMVSDTFFLKKNQR